MKIGLKSSEPAVRDYATLLSNAYLRLEAHEQYTIDQITKNAKTDPALAREQLDALTQLMGKQNAQMSQLDAAIPKDAKPKRTEPKPLKSIVVPQSSYFSDMKKK